MVKVRGQNSNRNTVKHTAEIVQKTSGDDGVASIASLVPGFKNLRLRNAVDLICFTQNFDFIKSWVVRSA